MRFDGHEGDTRLAHVGAFATVRTDLADRLSTRHPRGWTCAQLDDGHVFSWPMYALDDCTPPTQAVGEPAGKNDVDLSGIDLYRRLHVRVTPGEGPVSFAVLVSVPPVLEVVPCVCCGKLCDLARDKLDVQGRCSDCRTNPDNFSKYDGAWPDARPEDRRGEELLDDLRRFLAGPCGRPR